MKLYLSSYRIPTPQELFSLIGKSPTACRIALIPNARDYKSPEEYDLSKQEVDDYTRNLGFQTEVVDLNKSEDAKKLAARLGKFDAVWALGGNTFLLRHAMRTSGFDEVIRPLLENGLVYIGESAGAVVAGTSLKGIEELDDVTAAEEVIWEGLKLIDKMIIPHADSPDFAAGMPGLLALHAEDSRILLDDDQCLVINDKSIRLLKG